MSARTLSAMALAAGVLGCGDPTEAVRVQLPVMVDASGLAPVTTDLGFTVELTEARLAFERLVFTVAGEVHAGSLMRTLGDALVPSAYAHPGHYEGGEVTGELPGAFVVDWAKDDGRVLGEATLIAGAYTASNFTFARADAEQLAAEDMMLGHTAVLSGTAARGETQIAFTVIVDAPEGRVLVGAPFEAEVGEGSTGTLRLQLDLTDPLEADTLFDNLDFSLLDEDGDGALVLGPDRPQGEEAYNLIRRTLLTHDHYRVRLED